MPNDYPLPDGRVLVLPDTLSVGDRAFLRQTLGPEGYAQMQAHLASTNAPMQEAPPTFMQRLEKWWTTPQKEESAAFGQESKVMMPGDRPEAQPRYTTPSQQFRGSMAAGSVPLIAASGMAAPLATVAGVAGGTAGGAVGGYGGRKIGETVGAPTLGEDIGGTAGGVAGGMVGGYVGGRGSSLAQRILRGPGGSGEVTINPVAAATRELEARVPRNEPPGARREMQTETGQQSADAIEREQLAQRIAARQAAQEGKAVPISEGPTAPQHAAIRGAQANVAARNARQFVPVSESPNPPQSDIPSARPSLFPANRGAEPLVRTPEEFAASDQLNRIAEQRASERGMQYAGGTRTAGPNRPANRTFPQRVSERIGEDWESQVRRRAPGERPTEPTPQSAKEARDVEASKRREATSKAALNKKERQ